MLEGRGIAMGCGLYSTHALDLAVLARPGR